MDYIVDLAVLNAALFTIVYRFANTLNAVVIMSLVGILSCIAWMLAIIKTRFYYYRRAENAKMIELLWKKHFEDDDRFESESVDFLLSMVRWNLKNWEKIEPADLLMRVEYSGKIREYHRNWIYRRSAIYFITWFIAGGMLLLWILTPLIWSIG